MTAKRPFEVGDLVQVGPPSKSKAIWRIWHVTPSRPGGGGAYGTRAYAHLESTRSSTYKTKPFDEITLHTPASEVTPEQLKKPEPTPKAARPKANSLKLVPYAKQYNSEDLTLLEYTYGAPGEQKTHGRDSAIDWRPNEPFQATLRLDRLERGRSAARFWFTGEDGTHYPFFGQGLVDMLSKVTLDHGTVTGTWIAVKRGANYGIELLESA